MSDAWRPVGCLGLCATLASCSRVVFVPVPWGPDEMGVVVVTSKGIPIEAEPRISMPEEVVELTADGERTIRLFARTYDPTTTAPDGTPITSCGVTFGGEGARLPEAKSAWVSEAFAPNEIERIDLAPDLDPPEDFDLRFVGCGLDPCKGVEFLQIEVPEGTSLEAVAAVDSQLAYFAGRYPGDERAALARLEGPDFFGSSIESQRDLRELAWDGNRLLAIADPDGIIGFDPADVMSRTILRASGIGFGFISAARDGTAFAGSPEDGLVQISSSSSVAMPILDYPGFGAKKGVVVHSELAFFIDDDRNAVYQWTGDHFSLDRAQTPRAFEEMNAIAASQESAIIVGALELIEVREKARAWTTVTSPFGDAGLDLRGAAVLSDGRFAILAENGAVAVWNNGGSCVSSPSDIRVKTGDMESAPGGHVAYAVGRNNEETKSIVVKVRIEP